MGEPAIFDVFIVALIMASGLLSYLKFPHYFIITLIFLSIYMAGSFLSMYMMVDHETGFYYLLITIYLIFLWLFFVGILTEFRHHRLLEKILSGYTVAAFLSSVIAILSYFHLIPYYELFIKYDRASALFQDPNVFGPYLIPISIYAILKIELSFKKTKIFWFAVYLFTSTGVLLSFSRGAWLNYFVSLCVFILLGGFLIEKYKLYVRQQLIKHLKILLVVFFIAFICMFHIQSFNELFTERLGFQWYDQQRFSTQIRAVHHAIQMPLGIGPGQSEIVYGMSPHNLYVRVLTESGWLGFIGFTLFIMITLIRCIRFSLFSQHPSQSYYALFAAVLMGILANSFFIDSLHWRHFWFFLAFPWAPLEDPR
ncbi:hypothetical protein SAMN05421852_10468 [Thermoflavimicrobium dichotomicum]|uniref:O-antigen ligase-related domain-containing protein n=2 Tax=Thermoflavimicrobium dichotomicum TaxID=46223 RepID=A0A1I3NAX2_9BACL|nr:hypothetical protein SAMN05421852_10468 [Thermoflavimicrobium dichotomicum]